jgi:hypothetical protein
MQRPYSLTFLIHSEFSGQCLEVSPLCPFFGRRRMTTSQNSGLKERCQRLEKLVASLETGGFVRSCLLGGFVTDHELAVFFGIQFLIVITVFLSCRYTESSNYILVSGSE